MNQNPLIKSIDSRGITINPVEKSSTPQPQNLDHFLDQTLIKFIDSVSFNSISHSPEIPANLVQSMQELMQIIAHLRSPNGAWPTHLPQTPENLIPYVIEEVSEVLAAYQAYSVSTSKISSNSSNQKDSKIQPPVILFLNTLVPQLLWNFAQTSYQFMRLLTGVNAEILFPNQDWTPGKLRLVASLIIKTENLQSSIDLATSFFPPPLIPTEAYIQSHDCDLCQHPLEVQSLLKQITHHLQDNLHQINLLGDPINTEIFHPKSQWEPSQISIEMGFQFIPDPETSEVSPLYYSWEDDQTEDHFFTTNTPIQDVEYSILASVSQASLLKTQIRLTDPAIIQPYIQSQIQNYGLHWLEQRKQSHPLNLAVETASTFDLQAKQSCLVDFIEIADELVDMIYTPQSPSSLMRLQPEMPLIELSLRLLWQMIKSSYNIMQLISGIKAKVLQPGLAWKTGNLRLLVVLNAEFPNNSWEVDIASSQPLKFDLNPMLPDSVIQSDSHEWCRFPQSPEFLKLQIIDLLETTPELKSWIKGVKIDWGSSSENLNPSVPWKSGFAQLSFDFEWIPHQ